MPSKTERSIYSLNTAQRIEDIAKRASVSKDIVRRVLEAECDSLAYSLRHGERATLLGRCTIIPNTIVTRKDRETGEDKKVVSLVAVPSKSLEDAVLQCEEEFDDSRVNYQIPRLEAMQIEGLV